MSNTCTNSNGSSFFFDVFQEKSRPRHATHEVHENLISPPLSTFYDISVEVGTDKVFQHGYHFIYPTFLEKFRPLKFKLLEIGYYQGLSANLWEKYFPQAEIYLIDKDIELKSNRHQVIRADQSNSEDLERIVKLLGSTKIIVDDGSHHPEHQYNTFLYLFKNLLEPGGVYIIEDTECNYWKSDSSIYGYTIGEFSAIEETKKFVDCINSEFSGKLNELEISSMSYSQNCIIITKKNTEEISFFNRKYRFPENLKF
jgi:hypothetical protein